MCNTTTIPEPLKCRFAAVAGPHVGVDLEDAVRRHARLAYRVARSALRSREEAEDATQETFLRLLQYRKGFERADDPAAFIARVAWRVAIDRRRQASRRAEISLEEGAEAVRTLRARGHSTEEIAAGREMQDLLERLIATLPRKLRDVVRLSAAGEMPAARIASILNIPEASVRSRLFRARGMLKEKAASLLAASAGGRP